MLREGPIPAPSPMTVTTAKSAVRHSDVKPRDRVVNRPSPKPQPAARLRRKAIILRAASIGMALGSARNYPS